MEIESSAKEKWLKLAAYAQFERTGLLCVLCLVGAVTAFAIILSVIKLAGDFMLGEAFLDKAAFQDTFGLILTVVILLEFNHSIYVALTERSGAIQTRTVVLITVLVVARKLMLQDIASLEVQTLLGFGGLLLALGSLYWLISDGDRRRGRAASRKPEQSA